MQAIRLKLHQHSAVYRNPISGEIVESYPLVPPSTILGLISSIFKRQELGRNSFNLSIQGNYKALIRDYQWYKKYDERLKGYRQYRYPLLVHTLYDINLLLHIFTVHESSLFNLLKLLKSPPYFLYLGRAEDIIKIQEAKILDIEKRRLRDTYYLPYNAYIQTKEAVALFYNEYVSPVYHLATFSKLVPMTINKETKMIRDFESTEVVYVEKGSRIEIDDESDIECWSDGENLIWWSLPNLLQ
jgi:CRISPR-associated protein Cas5 subtype I-B